MIDHLLGDGTTEKVLLFLELYKAGNPKGIARFFNVPAGGVQKKLERLAKSGVITSSCSGQSKVYQFNPNYPYLKELRSVMQKAVFMLSREEKKNYAHRNIARNSGGLLPEFYARRNKLN